MNGGSWTFRVPKVNGPDFWTRVQLMAIGEKIQSCLDQGLSLCSQKYASGILMAVLR